MTSEVSDRGHERSRDFTDLEVFSGGLLIPELRYDRATAAIQQINLIFLSNGLPFVHLTCI